MKREVAKRRSFLNALLEEATESYDPGLPLPASPSSSELCVRFQMLSLVAAADPRLLAIHSRLVDFLTSVSVYYTHHDELEHFERRAKSRRAVGKRQTSGADVTIRREA